MSENIIAASLKLDGGEQAGKTVKSFKQELRESNYELIAMQEKFGSTSREATTAAKKVADLRDRLGDAKTLADAFNPDAKFKGFGNTIQAVAGGFSALTGVMALMGSESENVQRAMLKVQAAMAISQGINSILEGKDALTAFGAQLKNTTVIAGLWNFVQTGSFNAQKLTTVATEAQTIATKAQAVATVTAATATGGATVAMKLLRAALISTGIGALVVGVIALIQNFDAVKKAVLNSLPGLNMVANAIGFLVEKVTDFVGITSEAGRASAKALKDIERSIIENERFLELNADRYDQYTQRKMQADLDHQKRKKAILENDKLTEAEKIKFDQQSYALRGRMFKEADKQRAGAQKTIDDTASNKANQAREKEQAAIMQANDRLRTLKQENFLASIKDEQKQAQEKIRIDYENSVREIQSLTVSGEIKTELLKAQEGKRIAAISAVRADFEKKDEDARKAKEKKIDEDVQAMYDRQIKIIKDNELKVQAALKKDVLDGTTTPEDAAINALAIKASFLQQEYDLAALFGNSTLELDTELTDAKLALMDKTRAAREQETKEMQSAVMAEKFAKLDLYLQIGSGLGALSTLIGQTTRAGKAAALAEIGISTGVGFAKGLIIAQQTALAGGPGAAFAFPIFYAAQVAAVLNMAAKAKAIIQAGNSSGAPSVPMPSINSAAPQINARPNGVSTILPKDQINQAGNAAAPPVQAFIMDKSIKDDRERTIRLNRAARIK